MMGRTTLQEIKETLATARLGQTEPATPLAVELEALARTLASNTGDTGTEPQGEEPNNSLQQTRPSAVPGLTPHEAGR